MFANGFDDNRVKTIHLKEIKELRVKQAQLAKIDELILQNQEILAKIDKLLQ